MQFFYIFFFCISKRILDIVSKFNGILSIFGVDLFKYPTPVIGLAKKTEKNKHQLCYRETTKCKMNNEQSHSANMNILVSGKMKALYVRSGWADLRISKRCNLYICYPFTTKEWLKRLFVRLLEIKIQNHKQKSHTKRLSQR